MASTGFTVAGAGANNADAGDVAWANPGNIVSSNNVRATSSVLKVTQTSQYLHATTFGFSIPAGSTIDGVEVRIEKLDGTGGGDGMVDHTVQLIVGGSRTGDNNADTVTNWPTTETLIDYGGAADLWGLTPSAAQVNASNFGVALRGGGDGTGTAGSNALSVDAIWINVHYTAAAAGQPTIKRLGGVAFMRGVTQFGRGGGVW